MVLSDLSRYRHRRRRPTPRAGGVAMRGETLTTVTLTYGFEHPRPLVMVRTGLLT